MGQVSFSRRVPNQLAANRIAAAKEHLADQLVDLTVSNPTQCSFTYPRELLAPLAEAACLVHYQPDPLGLPAARQAVSELFGRFGAAVEANQVLLTASTSEAYAFLFKLLCDPGEAVLVPTPSYPLFEHLTGLECVRPLPYHLQEEGGWAIDLNELAAAPAETRAVVVVHPNNPTGSLVHEGDAAALVHLCAARGWALIADEVFLPFPLEAPTPPTTFAAASDALTFVLGGLSKLAALPQLKVAWMVAAGPKPKRMAALRRLEFIADAFLSVATPVQRALPHILRHAEQVSHQVRIRCESNLAELRQALAPQAAVSVPRVDGGWSAVIRLPNLGSEEKLVLHLMERAGVAVHPGYFFDFPRDGYLVVSLLPPPELFRIGVARLAAALAHWVQRA